MTACFGSLMSVPVRDRQGSMSGVVINPAVDYGLLLNRHELARYDGRSDELPVFIGYRGRVYDATGHKLFCGSDSWRSYAGRDCTADLRAYPRRAARLVSLPCVGALED